MRGKLLLLFVFLISLNIVYGNTEWEVFGGSVEHQGWDASFAPNYSLYATTGLVSSSSLSGSDSIESSLIIKNNIAYINGINGLYVRNLGTGEVTSLPHTYGFATFSPASTPVIVNDKYCYIDKFSIYCRYLANNSLAWQYTITDADVSYGESSLVFVNNRIWVGARSFDRLRASPYLYAFDENGNLLYKIAPPDFVFPNGVREKAEKIFTPTISGGKAIVAVNYAVQGQSSRIVAYHEDNGSLAWDKFLNLGEGVLTLNVPSVKNEKLFITVMDIAGVDQNDDILALNKNDGSLIWQAEVNNADQRLANIMPVIYADKIIVPSTDGLTSYVYAFNESNGNLLWTSDVITGDIQSSLSVADSIILFGTNDFSAIYGLSTLDGSLVWSYDPGTTPVVFTPAIVNGTVYFIDDNANFIEMKSKNDKSETITLRRGQTTKLMAPEADAEIDFNGREDLVLDVSGNVVVINKIDENSKSSGLNKLDKYVTINLDLVVLNGLDYIYIKHYYTEDELANLGLDESALKTYSFDGSKWNAIINSGVDTENNFVYANISRTDLSQTLSLSGGSASASDIGTEPEPTMISINVGGVSRLIDSDNDGIGDNTDNCKANSNSDQRDSDGDGIGDSCDNCVNAANGDQTDTDTDGSGNVCDSDDDNDDWADVSDYCPTVPYAPKFNYDGDTTPDSCDDFPFISGSQSTSGLANLIQINATIGRLSSNKLVNNPTTVNINLIKGLNLVSLPVDTTSNKIQDVLSSIDGKYEVVWALRNISNKKTWVSYNPSKPAFLQTLKDINGFEGFWIKMKENATLTITGTEPISTAFILDNGFNIIRYPSLQSRSPAEVFANVSGEIDVVYGYDPVTKTYQVYSPSFPPSLNTLTSLDAGKGNYIGLTGHDHDHCGERCWAFENGKYLKGTGYIDVFIASPTREQLIEIMSYTGPGAPSRLGAIPSWEQGSCDTRDININPEYDRQLCEHADAKLAESNTLLATQNGNDVSEKAFEWIKNTFENLK